MMIITNIKEENDKKGGKPIPYLRPRYTTPQGPSLSLSLITIVIPIPTKIPSVTLCYALLYHDTSTV